MDSSGCLNFCRKRFNENIVHCLYVMDVAGENAIGNEECISLFAENQFKFR